MNKRGELLKCVRASSISLDSWITPFKSRRYLSRSGSFYDHPKEQVLHITLCSRCVACGAAVSGECDVQMW